MSTWAFIKHQHWSVDTKEMLILQTLTEFEGSLSLYLGLSYQEPIFRPLQKISVKTFVECGLYSATKSISSKTPRSIHLRLPNQTLNLFLPSQPMLLSIPVFYLNLNHEFPALQLKLAQDNHHAEYWLINLIAVKKEKTTHSKLNIYLFEPR